MTSKPVAVLRFGDCVTDDCIDFAPGANPQRLLWLLDAARRTVAAEIASQPHVPTDYSLDFGVRSL